MAKRGCHWWPLIFSAIIVAAVTVGVTYYTKTGLFAPKSENPSDSKSNNTTTTNKTKNSTTVCDRGMYLDKNACKICPQPNKTFAVFWQSQTDGCRDFMTTEAFKYVTHIYWGFALINNQTGAVSQTFQGNDATLLDCAKAMKNKCVQQYASIGGATERANFVALNTPEKIAMFGKTSGDLVKKFNFDGIDIDDESGNLLAGGNWKVNASGNVLAYLQSIREALDSIPRKPSEPTFQLTWDEFPNSLNANCNASAGDYQRCYNPAISQLVDQVNIMMYNAELGSEYDTLLAKTIPSVWVKAVPPSKIILGGCVGKPGDEGACAYGASPTSTQLVQYATDGTNKYGGTMIWTASADYVLNKGATIESMGKAGNYGVTLP